MSHSLITPRKKPIFSLFSKIWISFIGIVFALFVFLNLFFVFKNYTLKNDVESAKANYADITKEIEKLDEITVRLKERSAAANEIFTSNEILKQSLKNLFDLVPDSITLNEILMQKNSLIIKGVKPSRDVYDMLLSAPLKSIFTTSNTSFFQLENGWLNFVSTNKIDNPEGYNE